MFRNTWTANDKYPVRDCENFSSSIQIQLPLKPKTFSDFFIPFLESTSNFKILKKKLIVLATLLQKLETLKEFVIPLSKKHRFRTPFVSQHVKGSQTLVKYS